VPTSKPFPDQAVTLGALLRAPYRVLARRLYAELTAGGFPEIRPAHSAVFRHITPEGSRLTDLAEQAEMTKQSMAYLVGCLEEHGYVKAYPDPDDGRARRVRLTARGRRLIDALLAASLRLEEEVARRMGRERIESLRENLAALDAALAELDQPDS
jgi:DNA-binding MarR family transcriptional regulator